MIPKFRAWIKSLELMADVLTINFEEETLLLKGHERNTWAEFEQVILMQYTGLKDKNGVEIYEGDVVAYTDKQGQKKIGKINYANAKYYIGNFETLGYASERYELEVIGNKFEHPELLEESK